MFTCVKHCGRAFVRHLAETETVCYWFGIRYGAFLDSVGFRALVFSGRFLERMTGFGSGIYYAVDLAFVTRVLPNPEDAAKHLGVINIANAHPQSIVPCIAPKTKLAPTPVVESVD
jgi:hypothetical protein